jgi:hypothetical protein
VDKRGSQSGKRRELIGGLNGGENGGWWADFAFAVPIIRPVALCIICPGIIGQCRFETAKHGVELVDLDRESGGCRGGGRWGHS